MRGVALPLQLQSSHSPGLETKMKFALLAVACLQYTNPFTPQRTPVRQLTELLAGGEGGDTEWAKALLESTAAIPGEFEKEMKMKGLLGKKGSGDEKLTANAKLVQWLEKEGDVYLAEESSWGEAPHPMAISTETKDEITNESSGRGLLARRDVNEANLLLKIPLKLCLTKASARKAIGKDVLSSEINEYLAIALQLIHERYVLGENSFWSAYIGVLPETEDVNPTFTWSDDDLNFLEGSPVIAATQSLQMKLKREYDMLLGGEKGLIANYPDRFPKDVSGWYEMAIFRCNHLTYRFVPRNSPKKTGFGLLPCYFLERFVFGVLRKGKYWPWYHMLT
jgi:histone-lysine N-methyltransferase SETD3